MMLCFRFCRGLLGHMLKPGAGSDYRKDLDQITIRRRRTLRQGREEMPADEEAVDDGVGGWAVEPEFPVLDEKIPASQPDEYMEKVIRRDRDREQRTEEDEMSSGPDETGETSGAVGSAEETIKGLFFGVS